MLLMIEVVGRDGGGKVLSGDAGRISSAGGSWETDFPVHSAVSSTSGAAPSLGCSASIVVT